VDDGFRPSAGYVLGVSIASAVLVAFAFHLLATFLPVGWTPPLIVGFYMVFWLLWTLPMSAVLGAVLGLLLLLTLRRLGAGTFASRRNRLAVAAGFGVLAGVGMFLIYSRLWAMGVCLLGGLAGLVVGMVVILLVGRRRAGPAS